MIDQISKGARKNLSPEEIGDLLLDTIEGKRLAFKTTAKAAYSKVDKLAKGTKVSISPIKAFARKVMKTAAARKGIGSSQAGDTLLKKVLQLDDIVSFKQAQALRSALLDEKYAMSLTRDKAIGLTNQFIRLTDNAITQNTKGLSPEALKAWRVANKFYRTGQETFNSKIIKSLTKSLVENPEVAVKKIFRPGASKQIKLIKNLVDNKAWISLKTAYLEQIIREASDADGIVLGKSFLNKLKKMGEPTLKELFNGQELYSIKSIGRLGELIQRPTGGSGGMVIQLMQAGAAMQLLSGKLPELSGESAIVLMGPPVLSRMLANPKWAKWLAEGYRLPVRSPEATALIARILKVKVKLEKEINKEKIEKENNESKTNYR